VTPEVVHQLEIKDMVPQVGDQWLANPPWKKTAEKMIPMGTKRTKTLPTAALSLSW
jgi:hypothetical protein